MRVELWLNALPDGSVVAAYDPDMQAAPGHKVGTSWMWRKEHGEWIIVGGGFHATHYVATHPNLTLVYAGQVTDPGRQKLAEIVHVLIGCLPRHDLQWIVDELTTHLDQVSTAPPAFDREKAERIWANVPYGDGTLPGRRSRIGTIDPATLEQLDVRGTQAREAVEQ